MQESSLLSAAVRQQARLRWFGGREKRGGNGIKGDITGSASFSRLHGNGRSQDGSCSRSIGRQGGLNSMKTSGQVDSRARTTGWDIYETRLASRVHVGDGSSSRMTAAAK